MTDFPNALPIGHRLHEYEIVRVLGMGGFGVTYLAFDHHLGKAVAIKEYLPNGLAERVSGDTVYHKSSSDQDDFEWGLKRFMDEARILARFEHPSIIRVLRYFKAHKTAYIVMEYAEGRTLADYLRENAPLDEADLKAILLPLLDGLEQVHGAELLHCDIKPNHIILRDAGEPVLIDFGAARRQMIGRNPSVSSIVRPCYSPLELYTSRGNQGPWTDIYALSAVAYVALTGHQPLDAPDRVRDDSLQPAVEAAAGRAESAFLSGVDAGLAVFEDERPRTLKAWRDLLTGKREEGPEPVSSPNPPISPAPSEPRSPRVGGDSVGVAKGNANGPRYPRLMWPGMALVLVIAIALIWTFRPQSALEPGETFRDCGDCPEMVVVPGGSFRMGSPEGEVNRAAAEGPQHIVEIGPFALATTEVTVAEFRQFIEATGYLTDAEKNEGASGCFVQEQFGWLPETSWRDPGFSQDDDHPVVCISWIDAQAYLRWLSEEIGRYYRLPSEAEQEYAIRANSTTAFPWGGSTDEACSHGNVLDQNSTRTELSWWASQAVSCSDNHVFTAPVGSYRKNEFGLYDLTGNAVEWTQDCWNDSYRGAPSDGSAWMEGDCSSAVLRGSSYFFGDELLRSASRPWEGRSFRSSDSGFRPASSVALLDRSDGPNVLGRAEEQRRREEAEATDRRRELITNIQTELNRLGREVAIDGVAGQRTMNQIGIFERATGRTESGEPSESLLAALEATDRWPTPQPGETFRDCSDCPEMVVVPAGEFTMGSPPDEPERRENEGPQHRVTLSAFALAKTEVTIAQWDACVAAGGCSHQPDDEGMYRREDRPVIGVSWDDAQEYVRWLSSNTGEEYRLPSEAEWEYATRAGTTTRFHTGDCIAADEASFHDESPLEGCDSVRNPEYLPMPVGSFPANAFGLLDMHGNAWEWVQDCYNVNYQGAPNDGSAWMSGNCEVAVMRGGDYGSPGQFLRSAFRHPWHRDNREFTSGVRPARFVSFRDQVDERNAEGRADSQRPEEAGTTDRRSELITSIQTELKRLGREITIDGVVGQGTSNQIRAFERASERAETGEPSQSLLAALQATDRWPAPQPGETFQDCPDCPEMVVIPGGSFRMGSPPDEPSRSNDEGPQRNVSIRPFALATTEVTVGEFRRFVAATGFQTDAEKNAGGNDGCFAKKEGGDFDWIVGASWRDPGFRQRDDHPAVCLSWNDAQAYIRWLGEQTGEVYRLPSEAEQEYVLRAGGNTSFPWGSGAGACTHGNVLDQSGTRNGFSDLSGVAVSCSDNHQFTAPVGSYLKNSFGLYDTLGNVWEWAEDCYNRGYRGAPSDGSAWMSGDCDSAMLRGGSWFTFFFGTFLRSAHRTGKSRHSRDYHTGFRPARSLALSDQVDQRQGREEIEATGHRRELIISIQTELKRLGREVTIDGIAGQGTTDQIRAFERATGRTESGEPSESLLMALEASGHSTPLPPGETFRDCTDCPKLVVIPGGSFRMGSPPDEAGQSNDEGPQNNVAIRPFALATTEVTVGEFRRFVNATGYRTDAEKNAGGYSGCFIWKGGADYGYVAGHSWRDPGFRQDDHHPVVCISWNDAHAYVRWLSDHTSETYRLPSEAEQEYVLRAESATLYPWGNDAGEACSYGNVFDQTATRSTFSDPTFIPVPCSDNHVFTAPVGSYLLNRFGLYDMTGNVWEWAQDCWNGSYKDAPAPSDGSVWRSGDCGRAVMRGGSWTDSGMGLSADYRRWNDRDKREFDLGFRPTRNLVP